MHVFSISRWSRRLRLWRDAALQALSPKPSPMPDDWFTDAEVAGYDSAAPADEPGRVDDATWRDLEARALLARIAGSASIYARQFLFRALRRGAATAQGQRPAWMGEPRDAARVLAQAAPARLDLRRQDMEVTAILFHGRRAELPAWLRHVRWARAAWLVAPLLALVSWGGAGALCVLAWLIFWAALEMRFHAPLQQWKRQRRAVLAMLRAIVDLGALARRQPHPALAGVADDADDALRLLVALDLGLTERKAMTADYVNLLTLHEYVVAPARIATLEAHLPRLRTLYATLAECDARLCLLAHLRDQAVCWPTAAAPRDMRFAALRNPLLDAAQPLSLDLRGQGVFLSGENGVGKSTLLRAIGLNLLTARAFGFCYAEAAALPTGPVWSSMVHEDSIATGDSLYMAEMRRGQALLRAAEQGDDTVFLVDEIFRGTNHV